MNNPRRFLRKHEEAFLREQGDSFVMVGRPPVHKHTGPGLPPLAKRKETEEKKEKDPREEEEDVTGLVLETRRRILQQAIMSSYPGVRCALRLDVDNDHWCVVVVTCTPADENGDDGRKRTKQAVERSYCFKDGKGPMMHNPPAIATSDKAISRMLDDLSRQVWFHAFVRTTNAQLRAIE